MTHVTAHMHRWIALLLGVCMPLLAMAAPKADDAALIEQLRRSAGAALQQAFVDAYPGLQLEPVGEVRLPACRSGQRHIGSAQLDSSLQLQPRLLARVTLACEGEIARSIPVWFRPSGAVPLWTTARPLTRGEVLTAGVIERALVPVTGLHRAPFSGSDHELSSFRARHDMAAGEIVGAADLERVPAVQAGAPVAVDVVEGSVRLVLVATADQDGAVGDTIRVRNRSSGDAFAVVVRDTNRGEVVGP